MSSGAFWAIHISIEWPSERPQTSSRRHWKSRGMGFKAFSRGLCKLQGDIENIQNLLISIIFFKHQSWCGLPGVHGTARGLREVLAESLGRSCVILGFKRVSQSQIGEASQTPTHTIGGGGAISIGHTQPHLDIAQPRC